ncbi:hypothetical protein RclHR1_07530001 [Rhizophagus clarus]|uniref:F-box domain-containing protein n=1 Tax=Rhizophagus clarus TaxID=94130 RepID=A0A2Z6SDA3_9GLOM|nr:hypothetical protein RclHR1_07530001 [Rhizophagus clarus]GES86364.1 hypothetical protein GLOIN_2v1764020 [Rhizophagus clarus]
MSNLNRDVLFMIFEELQDDSKFLFSCLMVNRLWCEIVIPVLWRKPWCYDINYRNKNSLYTIITSYLSDDVKEFLRKKGIQISSQSLTFDYLSFCKSINVKIIDEIISIKYLTEYNRFILQEEIYSFLIRKCPEIKYLNICGTYELVYLPESKVRLESICELTCDTSIDPKYHYRISHICQQIQRIIIINNNYKVNHGTTKLIEFQKNLKYFKWVDKFDDDEDLYIDLLVDPYTEIFHILKKHASTLNHFEVSLQYDDYDYSDYYSIYNDYDYTFLQYTLLELHNLKVMKIESPIFLNSNEFENELKKVTYRNLEILKVGIIDIYQATSMIKNSFYLKELWIDNYYKNYDMFAGDSFNFIRAICENCFLIEYLSIPTFPLLEDYCIEFEKLLKKCQKLRSLHFKSTYYEENELEFGKYLLDVLIKEAPTNLNEIGIPYDIRLSLDDLEIFLEKWKGRPAISIIMGEISFYRGDNSYRKLIDRYKTEGVIKYTNIYY